MEIRQVIKPPGCPHGATTCSVKAEEINARFSFIDHVGANVEFGELRQAGKRRHASPPDSTHAKRNDTRPTGAVKLVERQLRRDQ